MKTIFVILLISLSPPAVSASKRTESKSTGFILHKRTENFIDIEGIVGQVWLGCTDDYPKKANSYLNFYMLDGDTTYWFIPRRAIYDVPMCLEAENEYRKMIKGAKTVRIVGEVLREKAGPLPPVTNRIPKYLTATKKIIVSFFVRLEVNGQCKAYFSNGCDLPQNYWAGTKPDR